MDVIVGRTIIQSITAPVSGLINDLDRVIKIKVKRKK